MAKLTDKQELFCKEYLIDLNATQAAIRAGYSENTAQIIGSENLSKPLIAKKIAELKAKRAERVEIKADDIARQLDIMRRANISEYIEIVTEEQTTIGENGIESRAPVQTVRFKDFSELTKDQLSCIESVKQGKQGIELKLHGKDWTTEKLNRHIGFYEKDNKQSNQVDISDDELNERIKALKS
jgi:phage terminase small subunit